LALGSIGESLARRSNLWWLFAAILVAESHVFSSVSATASGRVNQLILIPLVTLVLAFVAPVPCVSCAAAVVSLQLVSLANYALAGGILLWMDWGVLGVVVVTNVTGCCFAARRRMQAHVSQESGTSTIGTVPKHEAPSGSVFISYKREDRDHALRLAAAIMEEGYSVWWDLELIAGEYFDNAITRELDRADSVVVLWSNRSVNSDFVKNEADYALAKLLPVFIEEVSLPLKFRRLHTIDLIGWQGEKQHPGYQQLVRDLATKSATRRRITRKSTVSTEDDHLS